VAVQELKAKGVKVYMLTGDAEEVARGVSKELGGGGGGGGGNCD